jgi:hypothetical protein
MNNPENFLTRWSRRKHAAAAEGEETPPSAASTPTASKQGIGGERAAGAERQDGDSPAPPCATPNAADPPFDPLSVPPIESIAADTDIRGFLVPGVPPELTRAALRRAWAADPKIRDFVGLADYDWDFNAPGAMAGFGSLELTDGLRQAAARIIGQTSPRRDQANTTTDQTSDEAAQSDLLAPAQPAAYRDRQTGPAEDTLAAEPHVPSEADLTRQEKPFLGNLAQDNPKTPN